MNVEKVTCSTCGRPLRHTYTMTSGSLVDPDSIKLRIEPCPNCTRTEDSDLYRNGRHVGERTGKATGFERGFSLGFELGYDLRQKQLAEENEVAK